MSKHGYTARVPRQANKHFNPDQFVEAKNYIITALVKDGQDECDKEPSECDDVFFVTTPKGLYGVFDTSAPRKKR